MIFDDPMGPQQLCVIGPRLSFVLKMDEMMLVAHDPVVLTVGTIALNRILLNTLQCIVFAVNLFLAQSLNPVLLSILLNEP